MIGGKVAMVDFKVLFSGIKRNFLEAKILDTFDMFSVKIVDS